MYRSDDAVPQTIEPCVCSLNPDVYLGLRSNASALEMRLAAPTTILLQHGSHRQRREIFGIMAALQDCHLRPEPTYALSVGAWR